MPATVDRFAPCALIPIYNHKDTIVRMVQALRAHGLPVVIVDDGSDAATREVLDALITGIADITPAVKLIRLPQNQGLGWHEDPATLEPRKIAALLKGGDAVVVKGSKKMFWVNKFAEGLLAALRATA